MPYTVGASFEMFASNISLTGDHKETAERRRNHIVGLLEKEFTIIDSFATGSIPNGTALRGEADLDLMVVLNWGKHVRNKKPVDVLQDVRDALGEYYTTVRKNGQAVSLYYESTWPNVDVVPVSRVLNDDGTVNYYSVPDANTGRWLRSRPRRHTNALIAKSAECGYMFKQMIRMVKRWNREHSSLMNSYHIEVLALQIFSGEVSDHPWDSFSFFKNAAAITATSSLIYEGGYADDYLDYDARKEVVKRLETARDLSSEAWYLTYGGRSKHREAIEIWRRIFGSKFPAYA
jgi:hypothetical protein